VAHVEENEDNAYLVSLVEMARQNGGRELPTIGTAGLLEARRTLNA